MERAPGLHGAGAWSFNGGAEGLRPVTADVGSAGGRFREGRRRTRPMGVFADRTSMERILFAVFSYENRKAGTAAPFLLTQNS